jgi:toxin ParE1/3/4
VIGVSESSQQRCSFKGDGYKGVTRPELLANLKSLPTKSHVIFYRITHSKIEIVRILHKRQDPQLHF